jgi:PAS domain-containing protein
MLARSNPEAYLDTALTALSTDAGWRTVLDELPVPIYVTDTAGAVTYWNQACIALAGRVPQLGSDRWCITWKIYTTTGEFMPHDECPMAEAIRQRRAVRDIIAIAERPDASRVAFRPYPTPLFSDDGNFTGAVNMLIDVTDQQSEALHEEAERCRRLADATYDRATNKVLGDMASCFDKTAEELASKPR